MASKHVTNRLAILDMLSADVDRLLISDFESPPQFHNLIGRDAEVGAGVVRIVHEPGKEPLAPCGVTRPISEL